MKKHTVIVGAGLALALLAGCASAPKDDFASEYHEWAYTQAKTTDIPAAAHSSLENGQVGDTIELGKTPWSNDTEFSITERYFAASGRPCFKGELSHDGKPEKAVICRYDSERWVATRAVLEELANPPQDASAN